MDIVHVGSSKLCSHYAYVFNSFYDLWWYLVIEQEYNLRSLQKKTYKIVIHEESVTITDGPGSGYTCSHYYDKRFIKKVTTNYKRYG